MIYLNDRHIYHNGIMVLPDYSNPHLFYYLPPAPHLVEDPESGRKLLKLIKFAGGLSDPTATEALRTGIVLFDCDLGLSTAELDELKGAVRDEMGPTIGSNDEISLVPVLYKEGTVSCYILGEQEATDDDQSSGASANIFVEKLSGFGVPSLYGDNRAAFSARMSPEGVTALAASLAGGGAIGISVVYSLKFDALRPAFTFRVRAEWERIYHFLQETYKADLFFFSYEDTSILEALEEAQLISFEEVAYEEGAKTELRELRKQLQSYLLETFFEPVLTVGDPATARVPGLVQDILRATVVVPSIGYKRLELTQEERKSLTFDLTQTTAVEQTIYPQAHLTAMVPAAELPSYVQEINSDSDPFFRRLQVTCALGAVDFAQHQIAWVHPFIRYGSNPEEGMDKTFRTTTDQMAFNTWLQPGHGFRYRTMYEVAFQAADPTDPSAIFAMQNHFVSEEQARTDRALTINPLEHFQIQRYEFALLNDFPSDLYPTVEVELRYRDSAGYHFNTQRMLNEGPARQQQIRVRTQHGTAAELQYRLRYHQAQGQTITKDWTALTGNHLLIQHPFPSIFTVGVRMAERPQELGWADITLRYIDPTEVTNRQEMRLFFTGADLADPAALNRNWTIHTANPYHQRYSYQFTIYYQDGSMIESPGWIESDARTVVLGRRIRAYRTVTVRPAGPTFASVRLRDIRVTLEQLFPNSESEPVEILLTNESQLAEFSYQFLSPEQVGYAYKILYRWRNGQFKFVQGSAATGDLDLFIPTDIAH